MKLKDFSINNQSVQIDKNAKNISVDLTEFFAKVEVSCKTEDASIYINNEQKGLGKWSGIIIPGKCSVEAKKDGYHTLSKSFELMDGDSVNVDFAALKAITGSLRVENELDNCEVFLNGKKVGTTPWINKDLPIGEYEVEIRHENYKPFKCRLTISEDQEVIVNEIMKPTQLGRLLFYAEQGNYKANCMIKGSENVILFVWCKSSISYSNSTILYKERRFVRRIKRKLKLCIERYNCADGICTRSTRP